MSQSDKDEKSGKSSDFDEDDLQDVFSENSEQVQSNPDAVPSIPGITNANEEVENRSITEAQQAEVETSANKEEDLDCEFLDLLVDTIAVEDYKQDKQKEVKQMNKIMDQRAQSRQKAKIDQQIQ